MKKVFLSLFLCSAVLFNSCENFLDGSNLKDEIETKVEYEKAESFYFYIGSDIPGSVSSLIPEGKQSVKISDSILVEATINNNYEFSEWRLIDRSEDKIIEDKETYINFSDEKTGKDGVLSKRTVRITFKKNCNNMELVPAVTLINDKEKPEFYGDLNVKLAGEKDYSKEDLSKNRTDSKIALSFKVSDNGKPDGIRVTETLLKDKNGLDPSVEIKKTQDIKIKFNPNGKTLFQLDYEYEMQVPDGIVKLDFQVFDASGNYSDEVKSITVIKDSLADTLRTFIYSNNLEMEPVTVVHPNEISQVTGYKTTLEKLQKNTYTVCWSGAIDSYYNGKKIINEEIENYTLSWGYDAECSSGSEKISAESAEVKERKIELSDGNFYSYKEWKYTLPEAVFDSSKDIHLKLSFEDSIGNCSKVSHLITKALADEEIQYRNDVYAGTTYTFNTKKFDSLYKSEQWNAEEGCFKDIAYHIFLETDDGSLKMILPESPMPYSETDYSRYCELFNLSSTVLSENNIGVKYAEIEKGQKIASVYLQPVFIKTRQNYYDYFVDGEGSVVFNYLKIINGFGVSRHPSSEHLYSFLDMGLVKGGDVVYGQLKKVDMIKGKMIGENETLDDPNPIIDKYSLVAGDLNSKIVKAYFSSVSKSEEIKNYNWKIMDTNTSIIYSDITEPIEITVLEQQAAVSQTYEFFGYDESGNLASYSKVTVDNNDLDAFDVSEPLCNTDSSMVNKVCGSGYSAKISDKSGLKESYVNYWAIPFSAKKFLSEITPAIRDKYQKFTSYGTDDGSGLMDFQVPLYVYEENVPYRLYYEVFDNKGNGGPAELLTLGCSWTRSESNIQAIIGGSKTAGKVYLKISPFEQKKDFTMGFEVFDDKSTKRWVNPIIGDLGTHIAGDVPYEKLNSRLEEESDFYIDENSFYRVKVTESHYEDDNLIYEMSAPQYRFASVSPAEGKVKMLFPASNGVKIEYDIPALVITYYADKDLGKNLSEWELLAKDVHPVVFSPKAAGTNSGYYYFSDGEKIPDNCYYITAAYFSDGSTAMTNPSK